MIDFDYDSYRCPLIGGKKCKQDDCPAWWAIWKNDRDSGESEVDQTGCAFHLLPRVLGSLSFEVRSAQKASEQARNKADDTAEKVSRLGRMMTEFQSTQALGVAIRDLVEQGEEVRVVPSGSAPHQLPGGGDGS